MKIRLFIYCVLGILFETLTIISLPALVVFLALKVAFFNDLAIWWALIPLVAFIVSVPLWWYFHEKVQKINLEMEEK